MSSLTETDMEKEVNDLLDEIYEKQEELLAKAVENGKRVHHEVYGPFTVRVILELKFMVQTECIGIVECDQKHPYAKTGAVTSGLRARRPIQIPTFETLEKPKPKKPTPRIEFSNRADWTGFDPDWTSGD